MNKELELQKIIQSWTEFALSENKTALKRNLSLSFNKDFAVALVGVRRSGKSTIAIQQTAFRSKNFLYINFEDPFFSEHHTSKVLDELIEEYIQLYNKKPEYVIFDEIHNIQNWERWARKYIDQKKSILILTGSSAKMLNSELSTSLTGRNLTTQIWPLTFLEYIQFLKIKKEDYQTAFNSFLKWGGFPRIALESNEKIRIEILRQYYSDATLKDVVKRNEIRDVNALLTVFNYYLSNISSLHSYNSIKKAFNLSTYAPIAYSQALQEAFLIFEVNIYSRNLKVQSRNPKKVYAIDTGFRNYNATSGEDDRGKLLENLVYLEFRKKGKVIYYHKNQFECDFVITENYKPVQLIQVTESIKDEKVKIREFKGLTEAMSLYQITEGLILTFNDEGLIKVPEGKIKIMPCWKFFGGKSEDF